MVAVAGDADGGAVAEVVDRPAEALDVEVGRRRDVATVQVAEVPGARFVRRLHAEPGAWLPEPELDALGVGEGCGAATRSGVDRRRDHGRAKRHEPGRGGLGVIDGHVRVPARLALPRLPGSGDRGDLATIELGDDVAVRTLGRCRVVERPAEQPSVELESGLHVGLVGVDPAGHALRVRTRLLGHASKVARWSDLFLGRAHGHVSRAQTAMMIAISTSHVEGPGAEQVEDRGAGGLAVEVAVVRVGDDVVDHHGSGPERGDAHGGPVGRPGGQDAQAEHEVERRPDDQDVHGPEHQVARLGEVGGEVRRDHGLRRQGDAPQVRDGGAQPRAGPERVNREHPREVAQLERQRRAGVPLVGQQLQHLQRDRDEHDGDGEPAVHAAALSAAPEQHDRDDADDADREGGQVRRPVRLEPVGRRSSRRRPLPEELDQRGELGEMAAQTRVVLRRLCSG